MKILMLSTDFPYKGKGGTITQGGGGACIAQLVGALLKKKVDVTVITRAEADMVNEIYDTKVIRTNYLYLGFRESKITHSIFLLPKSLITVQAEKPDIIHSHNPPAGVIGVLCSWLFRKPHVLTMHGPWSGVRLNGLTRFAAGLIEGFATRHSTIVTCDSKALCEQLTKKYGLRNAVCILNAVNANEFEDVDKAVARNRLEIRTNDKIVLFTGRFVAEKGLGYLLEAATQVLARDEDTTFLLIGGGFDEALVRDWLVKHPEYKRKIFIIPYLKHSLMNFAYRASDIFVLPTLAEGLSRSIMEAMLCGLPVIATNVGGNPELINEKRGILVSPKSPTELAAATESLLKNENLAMEFGKNAREFVAANLTIERRTKAFMDIYNSLVEQCAV